MKMHDVSWGQKKNAFPGVGQYIGPLPGQQPITMLCVPVALFQETLLTMSAFERIVAAPDAKAAEKHIERFQVVCVGESQVAWIPYGVVAVPIYASKAMEVKELPDHSFAYCVPVFSKKWATELDPAVFAKIKQELDPFLEKKKVSDDFGNAVAVWESFTKSLAA